MDVWLFLVGAGIVAVVVGLPLAALATRRRWGTVRVDVGAQGEGAYRAGPRSEEAMRGTPPIVAIGSMVVGFWALLTLLVFVPGGGLATAILFDARDPLPSLAGLGSIAVVISGVFLGVRLATAGLGLVRRSEGASARAKATLRHSDLHHAAVFVTYAFGLLASEGGDAAAMVTLLLVPCGIGALVGRVLGAMIHALDEVERVEGAAEGAPEP